MPIVLEKPKLTRDFADELTRVANSQLEASIEFKKTRMAKLRSYENLYAGKIAKRLRIESDVPFPVFSGLVDTLASEFHEPIRLRFGEQEASDYKKVKKIQAAYDLEVGSQRPDAKWDYKKRIADKHLIMSGRANFSYFAESDPEYKSVLNVVDYNHFHCDPEGGGHLEWHSFCGQDDLFKTESQLKEGAVNGLYDEKNSEDILSYSKTKEFSQRAKLLGYETKNRFTALGMDPENVSYLGEGTVLLAQWCLDYKLDRWYVLFDPFAKKWIRVERLTDLVSSGYYPYISYASHEDDKVFWSKSYADDFYPVAGSIVELANEELSNRKKRNRGARAYDRDMFYDVEKLDKAQTRQDALVPVDTKGGTRKISEGIYYFETPELNGTINLVDWMRNLVGLETGVTKSSRGEVEKEKKASVFFGELEQVEKRMGPRAQAYREGWEEIGNRYVQGLKDHLSKPLAIRLFGENGYEWDELRRVDLTTKRDIDVNVYSPGQEQRENSLKAERKANALQMVAQSPNLNPRVRDEMILRDLGGYEEQEIALMLDTQGGASKEAQAEASIAIQEILKGRAPEIYYAADTGFMQRILDYAAKFRNKIGMEKYTKLIEYHDSHAEIVMENMARKAVLTSREPQPLLVQ